MKCTLIVLALSLVVFTAVGQTYEQRLLAAVITAEAGNQGENGMAAVAEVIARRSAYAGKSVTYTLTRRNADTGIWAFSCLNRLGPERLVKRMRTRPEHATAMRLALLATSHPEKLGNRTNGATFFTRKTEKPAWSRGHRPVAIIGDHAFYRLPFP